MDARTAAALEESIAHWEENVAAERPGDANVYSSACALCRLFLHQEDICDGCPVFQKTGYRQCDNSPWQAAYERYRVWLATMPDDKAHAEWEAAAEAERDFLISLREPVIAVFAVPTPPTQESHVAMRFRELAALPFTDESLAAFRQAAWADIQAHYDCGGMFRDLAGHPILDIADVRLVVTVSDKPPLAATVRVVRAGEEVAAVTRIGSAS